MAISSALPKYGKYVLLAVVVCFITAAPSFGLGVDILNESLYNMQTTQEWWDNLWFITFSPDDANGLQGASLREYMFTTVVRWCLSLSMLFWCGKMILNSGKMMTSNLSGMLQIVTPYLLTLTIVILMLANNALVARAVPWGMRDNINMWRNGLMSAQIKDISVRDAISDVLITKQAADAIGAQAQKCSQMNAPAVVLPSPDRPTDAAQLKKLSTDQRHAYEYIDCLDKLQLVAEEQQKKAQESTCTSIPGVNQTCVFFAKFIDKTKNSILAAAQTERDKVKKGIVYNPIFPATALMDYVSGMVSMSAFKSFFNNVQWVFISMMELGLWVDALIAPIAVALSLVPGQLNLTIAWLISFLTIGLAQIVYVAIVGAMAMALSQTQTFFFSDMRFEMAMGLFAPFVSTAILTGGGIAAARSYTNQSIGLTVAVVSTAVQIGTSAMGGMARFADARR